MWCSVRIVVLCAFAWGIVSSARLRIGEVKQRLTRFGISTAGIVEAEALRELLKQCPPEVSGTGHAVPLERVRAEDGAMGAGVSVYDKVAH